MVNSGPYLVLALSAALVAYPYLGYPALMALIARLGSRSRPPGGELPSVSVIVAAYNEEAWISQKIESTLAQDYPADRLEVVVVSDGSTDRTAAIVSQFRDPRVKLLAQTERGGKSVALNLGVGAARGEVLVFTDANAIFAPGAIRRLAGHFTDPGVGLVSGQGLYGEMGDGTARVVANGYVRFEALIKTGESALGFLGGADGAIYAFRRHLYRDLGPAQVNDLLHPIQATLAGYASRFDGAACTVEPPAAGAAREFQRHARIIAQGFAILAETVPALAAARRWKALWVLGSHRLLRWGSALGLGAALGASLVGQGPFFTAALATQGLVYGVAAAGWLGERAGWRLGLLAVPYYFCVVSAAGVVGFMRFLRGGAEATWSPRGAAGDARHHQQPAGTVAPRAVSEKP